MIAPRKEFNLEKESLLASGVIDDERLVKYIQKLDDLYQRFTPRIIPNSGPLAKAEALFNWLWLGKPARYKPHGNYKLNDVIDAQLNKDRQTVGNCLGLTLLNNCLIQKMGLHVEALYLENAFGMGPHVLSILKIEESLIDVENIFPDGFDYKGHLNDPSRTRWGDGELVADIYQSLGNEFFEKGELIEALKSYDMAIHLNPHYEKACLNKIILLDKMGREKNGS